MYNKLVLIVFLFSINLFSQELDITEQLKQIKNGEIEKVQKSLVGLKKTDPENPSVIFLDALLTKDGDLAFARYNTIINNYPNFTYADACVYCVFSYHYALGNYKKAETYLNKLKTEYPNSKYIQNAERNLDVKDEKEPLINKTEINTINQIKQITNYTIQAGAFIDEQKAKDLENRLFKKGYKSRIKEKNVAGTVFNIVTVGEYKTIEEANADLEKINKLFNLSSRVVEITK